RRSTPYGCVVGTTFFSPDGKRVAYIAMGYQEQRKQTHVVIDSNHGKGYDGVSSEGVVFSPDSRRTAYVAIDENLSRVVLDGVEYGGYASASCLTFSPNGARVACIAEQGGRYMAVVDSWVGPQYDTIHDKYLVFSVKGGRFGYLALKDGKWRAVIDRAEQEPHDMLTGLVFSRDGKRVAYAARDGRKWRVFVDGQPGGEYDAIHESGPVFGPDGVRVAYSAFKGGRWVVVVDGAESVPHDAVGACGVAFGPDGRRIVYPARMGSHWCVFNDGKAGKSYDEVFASRGARVVFDTASSIHYVARSGRRVLRVEQRLDAASEDPDR
ncbi:MAG: hypothetical protein RDV41_11985, partial [Planctomycetota bacterium]|nr:hypothetical protein [Planctomycetota bacterium]